MKKGHCDIRHIPKKDRLLCFLSTVFTLGCGCGVFSLRLLPEKALNELSGLAENMISASTFINSLVSTLSACFLFLALMFFCGFCAIGQPIAIGTLFIRGLAYGASAGALMSGGGTELFWRCSVAVSFGALASAALLTYACRESIVFSREVFLSGLSGSSDDKTPYKAKKYCVKYIAFTVVGAMISSFEALLESVFL